LHQKELRGGKTEDYFNLSKAQRRKGKGGQNREEIWRKQGRDYKRRGEMIKILAEKKIKQKAKSKARAKSRGGNRFVRRSLNPIFGTGALVKKEEPFRPKRGKSKTEKGG